MPDNNRKVLSDSVVGLLNAIYTFTYDKEHNTIITSLSTSKRVTAHDASKPFVVIVKTYNKKFIFSLTDIEFFKAFQEDKKLKDFTLFDIHNCVNKLKTLYQPVNYNTMSSMLLSHKRV